MEEEGKKQGFDVSYMKDAYIESLRVDIYQALRFSFVSYRNELV